jgi:hypothetical protein
MNRSTVLRQRYLLVRTLQKSIDTFLSPIFASLRNNWHGECVRQCVRNTQTNTQARKTPRSFIANDSLHCVQIELLCFQQCLYFQMDCFAKGAAGLSVRIVRIIMQILLACKQRMTEDAA